MTSTYLIFLPCNEIFDLRVYLSAPCLQTSGLWLVETISRPNEMVFRSCLGCPFHTTIFRGLYRLINHSHQYSLPLQASITTLFCVVRNNFRLSQRCPIFVSSFISYFFVILTYA